MVRLVVCLRRAGKNHAQMRSVFGEIGCSPWDRTYIRSLTNVWSRWHSVSVLMLDVAVSSQQTLFHSIHKSNCFIWKRIIFSSIRKNKTKMFVVVSVRPFRRSSLPFHCVYSYTHTESQSGSGLLLRHKCRCDNNQKFSHLKWEKKKINDWNVYFLVFLTENSSIFASNITMSGMKAGVTATHISHWPASYTQTYTKCMCVCVSLSIVWHQQTYVAWPNNSSRPVTDLRRSPNLFSLIIQFSPLVVIRWCYVVFVYQTIKSSLDYQP